MTRKKQRPRPATAQAPHSVSVPLPAAPPPLAPQESPKESGIRAAGKRLIDSALDYALDRVWDLAALTIGGGVVSILAAIILYIRSEGASWLWPWFTHLAVFWLGVFLVSTILVVLAWRRNQQESRKAAAIQEAKNLRFATDELGYIDFFANKERAEHELAEVIFPINAEITGLGATATKYTKKIKPNTSFIRRQQIASKVASVFNEHSEKIERQWKNFVEIDDVLAASNVGCVNWLNPNDDTHRSMLAQQRKISIDMLTTMESTVPSLELFSATVANQKGASQDLNTAVARLQFVMNGFIGSLRKSQNRWRSLVALIDGKTLPVQTHEG